MATLNVTRSYQDGEVLVQADLDAFLDDIETFVNVTKINDDNIQNNGITGSLKLLTGSVTTSKIGFEAVTAIKLGADSVLTEKILDLNVTTAKIDDLAVTAGKLAADAVTTAKILDTNVTTAKLADDAVTAAKLADHASIDANRAVTTNHIRDAAVTTAKINDNAVTRAKIATNYVGYVVGSDPTWTNNEVKTIGSITKTGTTSNTHRIFLFVGQITTPFGLSDINLQYSADNSIWTTLGVIVSSTFVGTHNYGPADTNSGSFMIIHNATATGLAYYRLINQSGSTLSIDSSLGFLIEEM